jgi:hypothetical protein
VQDNRSHDEGMVNVPPSCGDACHHPVADAGTPSGDAGSHDSGTPSDDGGTNPTTDAGTDAGTTPDASQPEPDAGKPGMCSADGDCADGMECQLGFCVPKDIVPPPAPEPECSKDADCGSGCWCSNGQCVPKGTDPDTLAPTFSGITVDVTATAATVTFTSNEATSDNHVGYYRFDSDEVQIGFAVTSASGTTHVITISHLSPATKYYFYVSGTDAAGNVGESDLGTFTTTQIPAGSVALPAPFRTPGANKLEFAKFYNNGSGCGEVLGNLPGMTWGLGVYMTDANGDGYLEYSPTATIPNGTYELSYIDRECGNETTQFYNLDWANFGAPDMVKLMTADDRAFLYCNWYDAAAGRTVTAPDTTGDGKPDPSCEIRIKVASGAISGNGNMRDAAL